VSFNSESGSSVPSISVASGSTIVAPPIPTRGGYRFVAWYTSESFDSAWDFAADAVSEDTTLYAYWIQLGSIDVTLE
jgi:uncharacterized repeat protein (TIGR02543 family)